MFWLQGQRSLHCRCSGKPVGPFSIGRPENSYIWLQKKPTGWLTNAAHLEQILKRRCPGPPEHRRQPLMEFTQGCCGRTVFKTLLPVSGRIPSRLVR